MRLGDGAPTSSNAASAEPEADKLDGHHPDANNVVTVGSPGVLAQHANDLSPGPTHGRRAQQPLERGQSGTR